MLNKHLIISSWAPPDIGGPQNLYNLFSLLPENSYSILTAYYSDSQSKAGSWLPCDYYFTDHLPLRRSAERNMNQSTRIQKYPLWSRVEGLISIIPGLSHLFSACRFIAKYLAFTRAGQITIGQVKPETLIGISDTGPAMLASLTLSKRNGLPLVYFLFDLYRGNNLGFPGTWLARWYEKKMFNHASKIIVTNEGTQQYYQKQYPSLREHIVVIHNSVFVESYSHNNELPPIHPPYKIVFTGHVYWAQEQAVMNLIAAMKKLEDLPVTLDLYVPNTHPKLMAATARRKNIRVTSAAPSEMPRIQAEAALLFLPLGWNTAAPNIIATATPGKFTDYLAAGRPMLIHAPAYAYIATYARQHNLGLVVDQNDVDLLATTIRMYLKNPDTGNQLVKNSLRIFHSNHDARSNAIKLTKQLNMV